MKNVRIRGSPIGVDLHFGSDAGSRLSAGSHHLRRQPVGIFHPADIYSDGDCGNFALPVI